MDEELKHVCEEIDLGRKTREELVREEICTFADLIQAGDNLKRENVGKVRDSIQKDLVKVIGWYHQFEKQEGRRPDICRDFTEDAFTEFKKTEPTVEINQESALSFYKFVSHSPSASHLYSRLEQAGARPRLIQTYTQEVIDSMTDRQKNDCHHKFDYKAFSHKLIDHIYKSPDDEVERKPFVVAGRTQAGKSSVMGVIETMCGCQKMPLIVITKGVSESHDLHAKLKSFVEGTPLEDSIVCMSSAGGGGGKNKMTEIINAFEKGGTLVVADTHNQIHRAILCVKKYREGEGNENKKFVVAVDECDAMYRTLDRGQQFEQAFDALLDMKPALTVMISATPIPLMLELVREGYDSNEIPVFFVGTTEEYMGITKMKRLGEDEDPICLEPNELSYKGSSFVSGLNHSISIPYSSEKVKMIYDDALSSSQDRKGVLVLDCTSPRVSVEGNIFQKAEQVQDFYGLQGKPIVVATYAGRGISVKYPSRGWEERKNFRMNEMISEVDEKHGLEMPIFIFAFTKMRRGVSFRSARRVPTHMVIQLGRGHNAMNVVQAMGRATFNGKSVLEANGFQHVTLLTSANDYDMALKIQTYIEEIIRRVKEGTPFVEAVTGADQTLPDAANFLRHTPREIGQLKGQRDFLEENVIFDEPDETLSVSEIKLKSKYWANDEVQRLLRVLLQLSKTGLPILRDDICDGYNDTFLNDNYHITKTKLNKYLSQFTAENLIIKKDNASEGNQFNEQPSYAVKFRKRFRLYINDDLALTEKEEEDGLELEDMVGLDLGGPSLGSPSRASAKTDRPSRPRPGSFIHLDNSSVSNLSTLSSASNCARRNDGDAHCEEIADASVAVNNRSESQKKAPRKRSRAVLPMHQKTTVPENRNCMTPPGEEEATNAIASVTSKSGRKSKPRKFHPMERWVPGQRLKRRKVAPRISVNTSNKNLESTQPNSASPIGPTRNQNPPSRGSKQQERRSLPEASTSPANAFVGNQYIDSTKQLLSTDTSSRTNASSPPTKKKVPASQRQAMPSSGVKKSPNPRVGVRRSVRAREPRKYHPIESFVSAPNPSKEKAATISIGALSNNRASVASESGDLGQPKATVSLKSPNGIQISSEGKAPKTTGPEVIVIDDSDDASSKKDSTPPTFDHSKKRSQRRRNHTFCAEEWEEYQRHWEDRVTEIESSGNLEQSGGNNDCNLQVSRAPGTTRTGDRNSATSRNTTDDTTMDGDDDGDDGSEGGFHPIVTQEMY